MKYSKETFSLSIILPAYNEAQNNIGKSVNGALQILEEVSCKGEIILIDDGSTDKTGIVADKLSDQTEQLKVIHHNVNKGMGTAIISGIRAAKHEFVFYTDSDNQFDYNELKTMLPLIEAADIVMGFRDIRQDSLARKINSFGYNFLTRILFGLNIKDVNCSFKLFRKEIFENMNLRSRGFFIDAEILLKASRMNCKITQIPVTHIPRLSGKSKVELKSVFSTLWEMIRFGRCE